LIPSGYGASQKEEYKFTFDGKLNSAVIADADLLNKEVNFWIDESTSKLKIKWKHADGTVKTAEISSL
jgi:hypothetical protein